VLAGSTVAALSYAEHYANKGEILVAADGVPALASLEDKCRVSEWREGRRCAVVTGMTGEVSTDPWVDLANDAISLSQAQPWMLPAVFEKVRAGKSDMLSELRQVAALFLKFGGLQYDTDAEAARRLNTFIQWVEQVIAPYKGSIIQLTVGDKGSYLYVVFGAPIAHKDDAVHAVLAALELAAPPDSLSYIKKIQIGLTYGQMRVGAYGGSTHRTYGAIGDQTNLAARLMQAATPALAGPIPGQHAIILCNDSIQAAAQTQVEFESLPPITVKGKTHPIPIYRPLRKRSELNVNSGIALERAQRIDRLSPAQQLTLKVASVIGQSFTLEAVSAVYPEEHELEELQSQFQTLADLDLIVQRSMGASGYDFRDALTHEVAYNRMLFAQRRQLHRAVAELLEQTPSGVPAYAEIAHHWQAADEIPTAVQYLEKAGDYARRMGDFEEASRFFNASLALNS
jgi:class 3 adenylate cyclase